VAVLIERLEAENEHTRSSALSALTDIGSTTPAQLDGSTDELAAVLTSTDDERVHSGLLTIGAGLVAKREIELDGFIDELARGLAHSKEAYRRVSAGDVPRDRFDMDALCEPQPERRRDRLAVAMNGTRAPLGSARVLEPGTPPLAGRTCLSHESVPSVCSCRSLYRSSSRPIFSSASTPRSSSWWVARDSRIVSISTPPPVAR